MRLYGGIYFNEDGISTSLRSMHLQTKLLSNIQDNITGFNKVGYQRKESVLSSFSELVGAHALSEVADKEVGRLRQTGNHLDFSLSKEGYFQYITPYGVKLTRDGRFKLDKNGYLNTLDNYKVLSSDGRPVKFSKCPADLKDVKVDMEGNIRSLDPDTQRYYQVGQIGVVSSDGSIAKDIAVRQGYTEDSNVALHAEFFNLLPVRRNFEANRQLFIVQNDELSKTIQELGRSS